MSSRRCGRRTRRELLAAVERETGSSRQSGSIQAAETILAELPGYIDHYDQHREWIRGLIGRR
jgi:hypothetical protein